MVAKVWVASSPSVRRSLGAYGRPVVARVVSAGSVPATVRREHSRQPELKVRVHVGAQWRFVYVVFRSVTRMTKYGLYGGFA